MANDCKCMFCRLASLRLWAVCTAIYKLGRWSGDGWLWRIARKLQGNPVGNNGLECHGPGCVGCPGCDPAYDSIG